MKNRAETVEQLEWSPTSTAQPTAQPTVPPTVRHARIEGWLHKEVAFRKGHMAKLHKYTARYVRLVAPASAELAVGQAESENEAALMEPTLFFYKVKVLLNFKF